MVLVVIEMRKIIRGIMYRKRGKGIFFGFIGVFYLFVG